ncbi:MAG TPA: hypothetical protein VGC79_18985, partial [Polyangiaceae bacterium]
MQAPSVGARFARIRSKRYALFAGLLLSLGCALIDPIDAIPTIHGNMSAATGGAAGDTHSLAGGASAGRSEAGGLDINAGASSTLGSGGLGDGAPPMQSCTTNSDCDGNARCLPEPDQVCVRLDTGPCGKLIFGEKARDPNAIFIGAFAPLDGTSDEALTIPTIYEMAAADFNESKVSGKPLGGLRGKSDGAPSPLVVIVCNNSLESAPRALSHLINEVRVPAVLAAMDSNQLLAGFNAYPDTFFISAFNGSKALASVSEGRAWAMLGLPADYADIYAAVMPYAASMVRAGFVSSGTPRRDIRVAAVIETGNSFQKELADAVLSRVTFNGDRKPAEQPENYLEIEVASDGSNLVQVVPALYEFLPDLVFSFASSVFTTQIGAGGVMHQLNQKDWSHERPVYILSPQNAETGAADVTVELNQLRAKVDHKDNAGRVLGIGPAGVPSGMTEAYTDFVVRLPTGARASFGNYYDAFYFLAYSLYASPRVAFGNGQITAADLTRGMLRLTN